MLWSSGTLSTLEQASRMGSPAMRSPCMRPRPPHAMSCYPLTLAPHPAPSLSPPQPTTQMKAGVVYGKELTDLMEDAQVRESVCS
jgi:hypothetical protein